MTPGELPGYWDGIIARVTADGPSAAAYAMARRFHQVVSDQTLVATSHGRGTPTPAPPGGPPALVSGALKRSIRLYPATKTGQYTARSNVCPLIVYARIQELGGIVDAKHTYVDKHGKVRQGYLAWGSGPGRRYAHSVTIPARPYMRTTRARTIADGSLRAAAIQAVRGLVGG
jgi:hypothetical protein